MATTTSKLALTKPDGTDLVDIAVLNQNADKLDTAAGAFVCTSTTRPASPWNGQLIYETDTSNILVYRTSTTSWVTLGGSSVSATAPANAGNGSFWWDSDNGKLYIYYSDGNSSQWVAVSGGVGSSSQATNYLLNADMRINQRNYSSGIASLTYGVDRWCWVGSDGTVTNSLQSFTPGSGPETVIEARNFLRTTSSGQSAAGAQLRWFQGIEDVTLLAGKTVTISFYAKAGSGTPSVAVELTQNFGTGGSPSATVTGIIAGKVAISTGWSRYSVTVNIPSLSGKTLGTTPNTSATFLNIWFSAGSDLNARTGSLGIQNNTFDIWGVQVEQGYMATPFRTNQPNPQAELAACQRYYYRSASQSPYAPHGFGIAQNATSLVGHIHIPVPMRVSPTAVEFSNIAASNYTGYTNAITAATINDSSPTLVKVAFTSSGMTTVSIVAIQSNNNLNGHVSFSAEL